jgi:hypothetical protein
LLALYYYRNWWQFHKFLSQSSNTDDVDGQQEQKIENETLQLNTLVLRNDRCYYRNNLEGKETSVWFGFHSSSVIVAIFLRHFQELCPSNPNNC